MVNLPVPPEKCVRTNRSRSPLSPISSPARNESQQRSQSFSAEDLDVAGNETPARKDGFPMTEASM